jgi:hypothetical protein
VRAEAAHVELAVVQCDREHGIPERRRPLDQRMAVIGNEVAWIVRSVGVKFRFEHQ